jgi:hypothetical protein
MLGSILQQIDRIYGLDLDLDIDEFVISQEAGHRLAGETAPPSALLVDEAQPGEIKIGLYIGEETLSRFRDSDPTARLTSENFASFCTVTEEVSHFACLAWSAAQGRTVSQLELELQAEVDKFITSALLLARQNQGLVPVDLLDRLFTDFELRAGLDPARRERYQAASAFARSYCASLVRRFIRPARLSEMRVELRRFYRLSQPGKIGHIHWTAFTS